MEYRGGLALAAGVVVAWCGCGTTLHSKCPSVPGDGHDPQAFGAIVDPLSAMNQTQARLGIEGAAVVQREGEATLDDQADLDRTDWALALDTLLRATGNRFTGHVGWTTALSTLTDGADPQLVIKGGVGVRHVAEIDETYRRGLAARFDASWGLHVPPAPDVAADTDPFLALRPLDAMRYGAGWRGQLTAEARYELMGCYAPFFHVSGGLRAHRPHDGAMIDRPRLDEWTLPFALTVGAHREIGGDSIMVYGGLEVDVLHPEAAVSSNERVRFGVETLNLSGKRGVRLGFTAEIVLGEVEGSYAGVGLALPFGGGAP